MKKAALLEQESEKASIQVEEKNSQAVILGVDDPLGHMRLSTKQVSGITPCKNMLMNIFSSSKPKPIFFSCLPLFANTETPEQTSEANKKKNLEILGFNFA